MKLDKLEYIPDYASRTVHNLVYILMQWDVYYCIHKWYSEISIRQCHTPTEICFVHSAALNYVMIPCFAHYRPYFRLPIALNEDMKT